jgi:MFS family permease
MAPILVFTLLGGVVADRVERRRLLFITQSVAMVLALTLGALVHFEIVAVWMVMVIAVARGIMMSFNQPARQSLISDLVPPNLLPNAVALNSATLNLSRITGPAIGGILIASTGVQGAFLVNGVSFLAVLWSLTLMRFPPRAARPHKGILAELTAGFRYLGGEPVLRTLVVLALVPMVFGMQYMTMLTVFASDVLQVGGIGLGLLTASAAVGAVLGALFVASRGESAGHVRMMFTGLVAFGVSLVVFALSPWAWLSALALFCVGFSQQAYMSTNNSLIQMQVAEEFRGRVLSTLFLNRGAVPLGTIIAGFGTAWFGAQQAEAAMGVALVLMALLALRATQGLQPPLRGRAAKPAA